MSPLPVPAAWALARLPILSGAPPSGLVTLAALADAPPAAADRGDDARAAALLPLHVALGAVVDAVVAPAVLSGVVLDADADGLGAVPGPDGLPAAWWIARSRPLPADDPAAAAGALAARLLRPVAAGAARAAGVGARGPWNVVLDGLVAAGDRLGRAGAPSGAGGALLAGAGAAAHRVGRPLAVHADDGPAVTLRVPRTCCVLARAAEEGCCPTCPRLPDDATRRALAEAWLGGLEPAAFRAVTGRPRTRAVAAGVA